MKLKNLLNFQWNYTGQEKAQKFPFILFFKFANADMLSMTPKGFAEMGFEFKLKKYSDLSFRQGTQERIISSGQQKTSI